MVFKKALKRRGRARIALIGPPGSGKTYSALGIAAGLGKNIFLVDSENETASLYAGDFDFSVAPIGPPFSPQKYIDAIQDAEDGGCDVLIIDSLSHAWAGPGGLLEMVDDLKAGGSKGIGPWAVATPQQNALVARLLACKCHLIVTLRSKVTYAVNEIEVGGKKRSEVVKLGMQPIQREGVEYEFDVIGDMDQENTLRISKSRAKFLSKAVVRNPDAKMGEQILDWLTAGEDGPTLAERGTVADEQLTAFAKLFGPEQCLRICGKPRKDMTVEEKERAIAKLIAAQAASVSDAPAQPPKLSVVPTEDQTTKQQEPPAKNAPAQVATKPTDGAAQVSQSAAASERSAASPPAATVLTGAAAVDRPPSPEEVPLETPAKERVTATTRQIWEGAKAAGLGSSEVIDQLQSMFPKSGVSDLDPYEKGELVGWLSAQAVMSQARQVREGGDHR